jgi:hypothetical protein
MFLLKHSLLKNIAGAPSQDAGREESSHQPDATAPGNVAVIPVALNAPPGSGEVAVPTPNPTAAGDAGTH